MQKKDTKHSCALLLRLPSFFSASVFTLYLGTLKTFSILLNTAFDIFFLCISLYFIGRYVKNLLCFYLHFGNAVIHKDGEVWRYALTWTVFDQTRATTKFTIIFPTGCLIFVLWTSWITSRAVFKYPKFSLLIIVVHAFVFWQAYST